MMFVSWLSRPTTHIRGSTTATNIGPSPRLTEATTLEGLPDGTYYVYVDYCGGNNPGFMTMYYGQDAQGYPQPVTVSGAQTQSAINVQLQLGAEVSGHVYAGSGDGRPLSGVCVSAEYVSGGLPSPSTSEDYFSAVTASDGSYSLAGLDQDATYTIEFDPTCSAALMQPMRCSITTRPVIPATRWRLRRPRPGSTVT